MLLVRFLRRTSFRGVVITLGGCIARDRSCGLVGAAWGSGLGGEFLLPQGCCWALLGNDACWHDDWFPLRLSNRDLGHKSFYDCHCLSVVGHIIVANGLLLGEIVAEV